MYYIRKRNKTNKSKKYYYFKYHTAKLVEKYACSHNAVPPIDRGKWRKYNPYNPYVEEKESNKEDTKIERLDDLFEETTQNEPKKDDNKQQQQSITQETNQEKNTANDDTTYDLQKELEAKFDELFGAFDE